MRKTRYQKGSLKRVRRTSGRHVWVFRWRETQSDGSWRPRKVTVGTVRRLPNELAAWSGVEALHLSINADPTGDPPRPRTFGDLVDHYRRKELASDNERKAYSTKEVYDDHLTNWIVPRWGDQGLDYFERGPIAVHVEDWLGQLTLAPSTKAKIRNVMSAVCSHAIRYGWITRNPMRAVRQSAKRQSVRAALTVEELQALFGQLTLRDRALVSLDVPTGLRVGELMALKWNDINFAAKTVDIRKSIWHQHLGSVKTAESEKVMPLDDRMLAELQAWRRETPYAGHDDWVFASPRMNGKQPYWPDNILKKSIRPAAQRAGITKQITWHVFRHTFSTLIAANEEDVPTVQSLMRHANSRVTMEIYTHPVNSKKRNAQSKVVQMILPAAMPGQAAEGGA